MNTFNVKIPTIIGLVVSSILVGIALFTTNIPGYVTIPIIPFMAFQVYILLRNPEIGTKYYRSRVELAQTIVNVITVGSIVIYLILGGLFITDNGNQLLPMMGLLIISIIHMLVLSSYYQNKVK